MTTYYVGKGGSDGNNGSTWALRKLTLNGAEDLGLSAGDVVIVGPGTYREQLTCDASGSSGGGTIHFMGDPTGSLTDGIGGGVRITGSDDDDTNTRDYCVYADQKDYREFSYLQFDFAELYQVLGDTSVDGWSVHDCYFGYSGNAQNDAGLRLEVSSGESFDIRRCIFISVDDLCNISSTTGANGGGTRKIENCLFMSPAHSGFGYGVLFSWAGNIYIRNCTFIRLGTGVYADSNTSSYPTYVYNCHFHACDEGLDSNASGQLVEDYNNICPTVSDPRGLYVPTGSNSTAQTFYPKIPPLYNGIKLGAIELFDQADYSPSLQLDDDGSAPSNDIWGVPRPPVNGKRSLGAIQHQVVSRETTLTYNSSPASLKLDDAGVHQVYSPVSAGAMCTVRIMVYREANYSGDNPQLIIKESGQSDRTVTDTGSSGSWNQLQSEFTVAAGSEYITIELISRNTATSGSYAVYFDALEVFIV